MKKLILPTVLIAAMLLSGCGVNTDKYDELHEELLEEAGEIEDTFNMLQEEADKL